MTGRIPTTDAPPPEHRQAKFERMVKYAKDMMLLGVAIEPETPYIWASYFDVTADEMMKAIREARRELKQ